MKMMLYVVFMSLAVLVSCDEIKKDRGVLVLEKDTFQSAVTDNKHVLVEFCKYKHHLLPLFQSFFRLTVLVSLLFKFLRGAYCSIKSESKKWFKHGHESNRSFPLFYWAIDF